MKETLYVLNSDKIQNIKFYSKDLIAKYIWNIFCEIYMEHKLHIFKHFQFSFKINIFVEDFIN